MKKFSLLLLFFCGCVSNSVNGPVYPVHQAVGHTYQGSAIASQWNPNRNTFERACTDSIGAQIRIISTGTELRATVSINGNDRPFDVFLFPAKGGYYIGNDSLSFAYFSSDSSSITWGRTESGVLYNSIYATY